MNTPKTQYWRNVADCGRGSKMTKALHDACDEISKLETQVQELRDALSNILCMLPSDHKEMPDTDRIPQSFCYVRWADIREGRAILEKTK